MGSNLLDGDSKFHWALHIIVIVVLLYLLYVVVFSQEERETFKQNQRQGGSALVLFKATWCGACKRFMPEWQKMPNKIANVSVLMVDVDEYPQLTKYQGVNSFPTIMLLPRGLFNRRGQIIYDGNRKVASIVAWTQSNLNQDGGVAAGIVDGPKEHFAPLTKLVNDNASTIKEVVKQVIKPENVKSVSDTLNTLRGMDTFNAARLLWPLKHPSTENFDPTRDIYSRKLPGDATLPSRLGVERFDPTRDIYSRKLPGDPTLASRIGTVDNFNPGKATYPKNIPNMHLIENLTSKPYFGNLTDAISVGNTTYHDQADLRWGIRPRIMTRYPPGSYYNQNIVNRGYKY